MGHKQLLNALLLYLFIPSIVFKVEEKSCEMYCPFLVKKTSPNLVISRMLKPLS